jgi:hypothetical protein
MCQSADEHDHIARKCARLEINIINSSGCNLASAVPLAHHNGKLINPLHKVSAEKTPVTIDVLRPNHVHLLRLRVLDMLLIINIAHKNPLFALPQLLSSTKYKTSKFASSLSA